MFKVWWDILSVRGSRVILYLDWWWKLWGVYFQRFKPQFGSIYRAAAVARGGVVACLPMFTPEIIIVTGSYIFFFSEVLDRYDYMKEPCSSLDYSRARTYLDYPHQCL